MPYHVVMAITTGYRGRFAPTPSGPLHMGSLLTALLSYLDARAHDGVWMLRIDDLDAARCDPAHIDTIRHQLEAHALAWDGPVYRQSQAGSRYREALATLRQADSIYGCDCTRRRLREHALAGSFGPVYDGRCAHRHLLTEAPDSALALRMRVPPGEAQLTDDWHGALAANQRADIGDFVLQRRDGIPGYALASAVDEAAMGITHVVRGSDLLHATFMHWCVLDALGLPCPRSRHGPLLVRADGAKLSKQNHAAPLATEIAAANLLACCRILEVVPDGAERADDPAAIVAGAVAIWRERTAQRVPPRRIVWTEETADGGICDQVDTVGAGPL